MDNSSTSKILSKMLSLLLCLFSLTLFSQLLCRKEDLSDLADSMNPQNFASQQFDSHLFLSWKQYFLSFDLEHCLFPLFTLIFASLSFMAQDYTPTFSQEFNSVFIANCLGDHRKNYYYLCRQLLISNSHLHHLHNNLCFSELSLEQHRA